MALNFNQIGNSISALLSAFKKYRWKFSLIIVMGFLAGLSGAFGIASLIPLFSLLTGQQIAQTEDLDFITKTIKSVFLFAHIPFTLSYLVALMALLFILKAIIQFSAKYLNQRISLDYENKLRSSLFKKTLQATWSYLLEHKIGFVERILMKDVYVSAGVINQISTFILISSSFLTYAFVAFKISAPITLITAGFGILLFLIFRPILNKIHTLSEQARDTEKLVAHFVNENLLGAKVIKASAVESKISSIGSGYFEKYRKDRLKNFLYQSAIGSSFEPISFSFIAVLMLLNYHSPSFQIASFAAIIYLIQKMFSFLQSGQIIIQDIFSNIPYIQSTASYRAESARNFEPSADDELAFHNEIAFQSVKFAYNQDREVLSDINFVIKRGEMLGLIGSSGGGKTTIVDLLLQLFNPSEGIISVDGKNIREIRLKSWRRSIGYMPQDTFLLNDTIENNIRFYDEHVSPEQIAEATRMANISDLVEELPEGLQSMVGERGVKLSAGQRQRIMLARVLVRNPEILILDEATSALDNQSELMIQKAIESLRGKVTILVIAHRLSTIMNSDRLLVLDGGRIIEQGVPSDLLANKDSHFYKIYNIREE